MLDTDRNKSDSIGWIRLHCADHLVRLLRTLEKGNTIPCIILFLWFSYKMNMERLDSNWFQNQIHGLCSKHVWYIFQAGFLLEVISQTQLK